ncbi:hypothetical protein Lalb_Chr21g0318611 [Lupinus albus]|uniref:Uncharacterized protein n=1 Tax=Lupinus albus TaxID=3870 RepID=A0A6A4NRT4_LUPAL|nr:hypothetical protein Lalb_Chr21g0318611 [Lupinus albus]
MSKREDGLLLHGRTSNDDLGAKIQELSSVKRRNKEKKIEPITK